MSRSMLALLLVCAVILTMPATGLSAKETAMLTFQGVVHINRPDVQGINPVCKGLRIAWICRLGQVVAQGDPMIIFDNRYLVHMLNQRQYDLKIAQAKLLGDKLQQEAELALLKEEAASLEAELAVVGASLVKARRIDQDQVALLGAQYECDKNKLQEQRRTEENTQVLYELGEVSADELLNVKMQTGKSQSDVDISRLKWQRQGRLIDELKIARLELDQRQLLMKIGREEVNQMPASTPAPGAGVQGIVKRIETVAKKIERQHIKNQAALERAQKQLHEAERNAYDCTPLTFVELTPANSDDAVRRIAFGPSGAQVPDGYAQDHGEPFSVQRGFGWDRDLSGAVHLRKEQTDPLDTGVIVIQKQATWRCALPNGQYRLRIGVGDALDWHGSLIRVGQMVLFTAAHLKKPQVVDQIVTITDNQLVMVCGSSRDKVMRAPAAGVAKPQPWLRVGHHVEWEAWPLAYFIDPNQYTIEALVNQDQVALLKVQSQVDQTDKHNASVDVDQSMPQLHLVQDVTQVATSRIELLTSSGMQLTGQVTHIGHTPVCITLGPLVWRGAAQGKGKDLIARQVLIKPDKKMILKLKLGETVRCRARITPGDDMIILPVHLVAQGRQRNLVTLAGSQQELEIEGFRVGQSFFVTRGLEPAVLLAAPVSAAADQRQAHRRFPGEVVPGRHTNVGIPTYWGRIKDMVQDASTVARGEQIITLYNPVLDVEREEIKEKKIKARQDYLLAMETRRLKSVEAQAEHKDKVIAERQARIALRRQREHNPLPLAQAQAAWKQAQRKARIQGERYDKIQSMDAISRSELVKGREAAQSASLAARRAYIAYIITERSGDWVELNDARRAWLNSVDDLSLRPLALHLIRKEEQVSRLSAQLELQRAMEGNWRQRIFQTIKNIKAPVSGRIFYNTGWNYYTLSYTKIMKDFIVWGGLPLAQILDMSDLGMEAELPEDLYSQVESDTRVMVGFTQYPGVEIEGAIDRIGKYFYIPTEFSDAGHGEQSVSLRRVFTVTVRFSPPKQLADKFVPGTKGYIYQP